MAIKIRERTTCEMATCAIFFELPIFSPFSSKTAIPSINSLQKSFLISRASRYWQAVSCTQPRSHHGNVDAIGSGDSCQGNKAANKRRKTFHQAVESQCGCQCARSGETVRLDQLSGQKGKFINT